MARWGWRGGGSVRGLWKERESPSLFDFVLCGGMYVCYFRQQIGKRSSGYHRREAEKGFHFLRVGGL